MRFFSQIDKRIYFLIFYITMMTLWIAEELISHYYSFNFLRSSQKIFSYMEVFMAILSALGIFYLIRLLTENKKEVDEAKELISNLKNQNKLLLSDITSFWNNLQSQFKSWNLSEVEKEISVYILRGLSNQQIAAIRNKSLKTIENQTFSIFQKSGTTGKLEFIAYFISPLLPEED